MKNKFLFFLPLYYATTNAMLKQGLKTGYNALIHTPHAHNSILNGMYRIAYNVLGLPENASKEELKEKIKKLEEELEQIQVSTSELEQIRDNSDEIIKKKREYEYAYLLLLDKLNGTNFYNGRDEDINMQREFIKKFNGVSDFYNLFKSAKFQKSFMELLPHEKKNYFEKMVSINNRNDNNFIGFINNNLTVLKALESLYLYNNEKKNTIYTSYALNDIIRDISTIENFFNDSKNNGITNFFLNDLDHPEIKKAVMVKELEKNLTNNITLTNENIKNIFNNEAVASLELKSKHLFIRVLVDHIMQNDQLIKTLKGLAAVINHFESGFEKIYASYVFLKGISGIRNMLTTKTMQNLFQENNANVDYYVNFINDFDKKTKKFSLFSKKPSWENEKDVLNAFKGYQKIHPQ